MLFFSKKTVVVALSLAAILVSINGYTANKPQTKPATASVKVSTLGGKFSFSLPKGYVASAMSAGNELLQSVHLHGVLLIDHGGDRLPWAPDGDINNFASLSNLCWQIHVYGVASDTLVA